MGKLSSIREALRNVFKPVTIEYPAGEWPGRKYSQVPPGLRGRPEFDGEKCVGCAACVAQCSSGALSYEDEGGLRRVRVFLGRCLFCGRCEEICPEEAIKLTEEFELAYVQESEGAYVENEVELAACRVCGTPFAPGKHLERIRERILENIDPSERESISRDMDVYLYACPNCRRLHSYEWNTHVRKRY